MRNQKLVNAKTGEPFTVEIPRRRIRRAERFILFYKPSLERLGINVDVRTVDDAQYENRLRNWDFDIIIASWGNRCRPATSSATTGARRPPTRRARATMLGIKNPAVDALIERVIFAKNRAELVAATKALDRVLLWNHYVVPQWTYGKSARARWDRFGRPDPLPKYGARRVPDDLVVGRGQGGQGRDALVTDCRDVTRRETLRHRRRRARVGDGRRPAPARGGPSAHGMSAFGDLKYPADFTHFDYVDPNAPKGGVFSQIGPSRAVQSELPHLQFAQQLHPQGRRRAGHGADLREPDGARRRRAGRHVRARRARGADLGRRAHLSLPDAAGGARSTTARSSPRTTSPSR